MAVKVIYASDLDNTLIFSEEFAQKNNSETENEIVDTYKTGHSVMSKAVRNKLRSLTENKSLQFVPVTTRDDKQYKRVNLGVKPEYAIVANGGIILHNGEPIEEWTDYVMSKFNYLEAMQILSDLDTEFESIENYAKVVNGCFLMFKISKPTTYDVEIEHMVEFYKDWQFVRQGNKGYAFPKHFSKQIALRWLWNILEKPYIVASGDSELDIPMLAIANRAIVPKHSSLFKDGYIESCTVANGGINSPLETMEFVEKALK